MAPINIDNTILDDADRCGRYYALRHIEGLVPLKSNISAEFGIAIHTGIYRLGTGLLVDAAQAFGDAWRPFDGVDSLRTLDKGLELLIAYEKKHGVNWKLKKGEIYFSLPLTDEVTYSGIIDQVGLYEGEWAVCDVKTTTMPHLFNLYPNNQLIGYSWAGQLLFGEHFTRALVDLIGIYKSSKDGKYKKSNGEVVDCVQRKVVNLSDQALWEFEQDVLSKVETIQRWTANKYFPKRTSNCQHKYGLCPYHPICSVSGEAQTWAKETFYRVERWEPGRGGKQE